MRTWARWVHCSGVSVQPSKAAMYSASVMITKEQGGQEPVRPNHSQSGGVHKQIKLRTGDWEWRSAWSREERWPSAGDRDPKKIEIGTIFLYDMETASVIDEKKQSGYQSPGGSAEPPPACPIRWQAVAQTDC